MEKKENQKKNGDRAKDDTCDQKIICFVDVFPNLINAAGNFVGGGNRQGRYLVEQTFAVGKGLGSGLCQKLRVALDRQGAADESQIFLDVFLEVFEQKSYVGRVVAIQAEIRNGFNFACILDRSIRFALMG